MRKQTIEREILLQDRQYVEQQTGETKHGTGSYIRGQIQWSGGDSLPALDWY